MKILLTTVMVLGAVFMLEANSPAEAMGTQAVISGISGTQQSLIAPAHFHRNWMFGNPYWGNPYTPYYYNYEPINPGISLFFSF